MATHPTLCQTVLDARDIRALAEFYRELLGLVYRPGDEPPSNGAAEEPDWLVLRTREGGRALAFQRDEDLVPTTWPAPEVPMQVHLDMTVPDVPALESVRERAVALGARVLRAAPDDPEEPIYVLADPAGHPFCVFVA